MTHYGYFAVLFMAAMLGDLGISAAGPQFGEMRASWSPQRADGPKYGDIVMFSHGGSHGPGDVGGPPVNPGPPTDPGPPADPGQPTNPGPPPFVQPVPEPATWWALIGLGGLLAADVARKYLKRRA